MEEQIDVLILTAVKDEYDQVLPERPVESAWRTAEGPCGYPVAFTTYELPNSRVLRVAKTWAVEMGGTASAAVAATLVSHYNPDVLTMCGICAGRREHVSLGDVIFGERLWTYDTGKMKVELREDNSKREAVQGDHSQYRLPLRWKMAAESLEVPKTADWLTLRPLPYKQQEEWLLRALRANEQPLDSGDREKRCPDWGHVIERLRNRGLLSERGLELTPNGEAEADDLLLFHPPSRTNAGCYPDGLCRQPAFQTHVAPIATGSKVVQHPGIFEELSVDMRKVLGLEMEASAIGAVAELKEVTAVVVKGVADFADDDKDDRFRKFAARASAECLFLLLNAVLRVGTPPVPIVGEVLAAPGPPLANDALALSPVDYPTLPFDLGFIWGLERGSFLGVVTGIDVSALLGTLLRTERALLDALSRTAASTALPRRRWLLLVPESCPNGPVVPEQLWSACRGIEERLVETVRQEVSQGGLVGFLFPLESMTPDWLALAQCWTTRLFGPDLLADQSALVFCTSAKADRVRRFADDLRSAVPAELTLPIDAVTAAHQIEVKETKTSTEAEPVLFEEPVDASPCGLGMAVWVQRLVTDKSLDRRRLSTFSALAGWLDQLDRRLVTAIKEHVEVDLDATRRDLERFVETEPMLQVVRDFLALAARHDRARAGSLLSTAARSRSYRLRREALSAASSDDALVDRWLCGADRLEEDLKTSGFLIANPVALADPLALGVLRMINSPDRDQEHWRELLAIIRPVVGPEVDDACAFCLGERDEEQFWRRGLARSCLAVVRAGSRVRPSAAVLNDLGLCCSPPWWLLSASPPDSHWLEMFLLLPPELRWVVGLVSCGEREELRRKPVIEQDVVACRRGRRCA